MELIARRSDEVYSSIVRQTSAALVPPAELGSPSGGAKKL
jgi:hypothetical protein